MQSGNLLYKCRLCGVTFVDAHVPDILESMGACRNGKCGIADLIGAEPD